MTNAYANRLMGIAATAAWTVCTFSLSAASYETAGSGTWSTSAVWKNGTVPPCDGTVTNNIKNGHAVTFDGTDACWHTMYIGASSGSSDSVYRQVGGTLTSARLTEINSNSSRTGQGLMELENVDATFSAYRLLIGRNQGNATLNMMGGTLSLTNSAYLMMGISTVQSAPPNRLRLENAKWTHRGAALEIGFSSAGTNIVHLKDSSFDGAAVLYLGYGANTSGVVGHDFWIAENSAVSFGGYNLLLPNHVHHSPHLVLSNSTLQCGQLLVGNVAFTTNYLEFIDCPPIQNAAVSYVGYRANTVNNILFKDLRAPKGTASEVLGALTCRSEAGERRWFDFTFDNCDWSTTSGELRVSQEHNERKMTFRNMALPNLTFQVGYHAAAPATLVVSNCTWNATSRSLHIANHYDAQAGAQIYDSTLTCLYMNLCDDKENTEDQPQRGDLLVSGGSLTVSGQLQVRRGTGRLVLERGAQMTCGDAYIPNMTGSAAEVVVGENCRLSLTNKLVIGNQNNTSCDLTIRSGGVLSVAKEATCGFGKGCTNFVLRMEGGELDLGARAANFATVSTSAGIAYLRGGVIQAMGFGEPAAAGTQQIVFDGTTVKTTGTCTLIAAKSAARVANGGAIFEVADGQKAYLSGALQHDSSANAIDGGLVKKGAGTLEILAAGSTFTGPVRVEGGTLKISATGGLPANTKVYLNAAAGARLTRGSSATYPEDLALEVTGTLDGPTRYVLAEGWTGNLPTITGLPQGWVAELANGQIVARAVRGFMLIVK